MSVLILGCGKVGYFTAFDLFTHGINVSCADINEERISKIKKQLGIHVLKMDATKIPMYKEVLKKFDVIATALPGSIAFNVLKYLVKLGINVVDISYFPEDPWPLNELSLKSKCKIVVDAGLAPGISNILIANSYRISKGQLNVGRIYVGGLSLDPNVPLGIVATWSIEDLLDEYLRPARAIINGKVVRLDLSVTGNIEIPSVGTFEYFASDGIRTMLRTFNNVKELIEYTIRYKNHISIMKALRMLGLLSRDKVDYEGKEISLMKLLSKVLEKKLSDYVKDRVILFIITTDKSGLKKKYLLNQTYDELLGISAMAKVTGCTQSIITQIILKNLVEDYGLIPPELIGLKSNLFNFFISELNKRGIYIKEF